MITLKSLGRFTSLIKLSTLTCLASMVGCASTAPSTSPPELPKTLGRVMLETTNRSPFTFSDRLFGRIIYVEDSSNNEIFSDLNFSSEGAPRKWLDLPPGIYQLRAQCENFPAFRGARNVWMVSDSVQIQVGKTVMLGCEYYQRGKSDTESVRLTRR